MLVGPKPDWLRDRFGAEAHADKPPTAESVFVVSAGPRRRRLRLELRAREIRFESWRGNHKAANRGQPRTAPIKQIMLSALAALGVVTGAAGFADLGPAAGKGDGVPSPSQHSVLHQLESAGDARGLTVGDFGSMRR